VFDSMAELLMSLVCGIARQLSGVAEFIIDPQRRPQKSPLILRRWTSVADAVRTQVRNQPPLARFLPSSVDEFNPLPPPWNPLTLNNR